MNNQTEFNSFSVIKFSWKWRKPLIIITLTAGILGFIFSMFIKPMYRSTAIVYAPLYNSFVVENLDVRRYGHEHETEQLVQILNSRDLMDSIAVQFNLTQYYGIDTLDKYWRFYLYKEMGDNFDVKRTQYGAVSITVRDKDPHHAAMLANAMLDKVDVFRNEMDREHAEAVCNLLQKQIDEVHAKMVIVNDSVQKLANEGIFIYDVQVERVIQQYATALGQGNTAGAQRIQKEIDRIAKWGPTCVILREELIYLVRRETQLKTLLWNAEMNVSGLIPAKHVVEKAVPIEKKISPKKSMIAIFSAIGAFFVTFFALLIIEKLKEFSLEKKDE